MALPHSPEEKELTEGDPERALRAQGMQLNETTPFAINYAKQKWRPSHRPIPRVPQESLLSNFYLTNLTGDCTSSVKAQ